jgi:hypothetical protein
LRSECTSALETSSNEQIPGRVDCLVRGSLLDGPIVDDVAPDRLGDLIGVAGLLGDQLVDLLLAPVVLGDAVVDQGDVVSDRVAVAGEDDIARVLLIDSM